MPWIKWIEEEDADDELAEQYTRLSAQDGIVDHILKIHGLNPPSLKAHHDLYRILMFGASPLKRAQREMIAVVVSTVNQCHY